MYVDNSMRPEGWSIYRTSATMERITGECWQKYVELEHISLGCFCVYFRIAGAFSRFDVVNIVYRISDIVVIAPNFAIDTEQKRK